MRVLIVRIGAMGDVVHALPAAAALCSARPEWTIDWIVDERWQTLLGSEGGPVVNRTYPVPVKAWKEAPFSSATRRSLLAFRKLRGQYDLVVDMQGTIRSALIGRLAGGRTLAGFRDPREAPALRLYGKRFDRQGQHVVEQGAGLLGEACGVELTPLVPEIAREDSADRWAAEEAGGQLPLAVLSPRAGWGAKQWPAERFAELALRLKARDFDVAVNAAHKDDEIALRVVAASQGAARVAVCDVAGLVALLRRAGLFVGGDSGPTHLAAALRVPLVGLYGPTDPDRNGPWGPGPTHVLRHQSSTTSHKRVAEIDHGLTRLSVDEVVWACLEAAGLT